MLQYPGTFSPESYKETHLLDERTQETHLLDERTPIKTGLSVPCFLGSCTNEAALKVASAACSTSKTGLSVGKESKVGPEQGHESSRKVPWWLSPGRARESHSEVSLGPAGAVWRAEDAGICSALLP